MAWTIDKPSDYFDTLTWSGNSTDNRNIIGLDFTPDWLWIKQRNAAYSTGHQIYDVVRGVGNDKEIDSSSTAAEGAGNIETFGYPSALISGGFTATQGTTDYDYVNKTGITYVAWNWKAGTSFTNDASATGIGSIDSTGSVNTTSGFSICSYTGTGSAGTIKHGLSSAPRMVIVKERSGVDSWIVGHTSVGFTKNLLLDGTNAEYASSIIWNDTAPTSSVFSIGSSVSTNQSSATYIAYCFADVQGYSKFGIYTGNGNADGTFVYTGFKPAMVIVKQSNTSRNWLIMDNKRNEFNDVDKFIKANTSDVEGTTTLVDFTSNGFKCRTTDTGVNESGGTYIYMAFAENPFVSSTGVPACAR